MNRVVYRMPVSLDGFVETRAGKIDVYRLRGGDPGAVRTIPIAGDAVTTLVSGLYYPQGINVGARAPAVPNLFAG